MKGEFQYVKDEKEKWKETALEQAAENKRLSDDLKFYKGISLVFALCGVLLCYMVVAF